MSTEPDERYPALIDDLRALPAETEWVEFKKDNADPKTIGRSISAISNSIRIDDRDRGYVVWGVRDGDHAVVGTTFRPDTRKIGNQPLELWLRRKLRPAVGFDFKHVRHPNGRLVLLEVSPAAAAPAEFDGAAYVRIGEATSRLANYPDKQRAFWDNLRAHAWETDIALGFVDSDSVLDLLDWRSYFTLTGQPEPENRQAVPECLASDGLISRGAGNNWNILNLGAILFAGDLGRFDSSLARKAVRFVRYDGDGRTATPTNREGFPQGYASGFAKLNGHVNALVPAPERPDAVVREARPLFPPIAVRELIANALIHQDMTITGAGPTVEMFRDRLEIANPGAPLVDTDRFIDHPPRSRNEKLASLMRSMKLCEELGSGIDKVVGAVERAQLPPPEFSAAGHATRTVLFGPRRFAEMTIDERLRACYHHAVLSHVERRWMKNASLRERFGVDARNAAQISGVIRRALERGLIRVADPNRPRAGYIPSWA